MADLSVPSGCPATVANVADLWQRVVGTAPDTSSSSAGEQSIIGALHLRYFEALQRLAVYGYSDADAASILAGSLLSPLIKGALCWAVRDSEELDASREQVVEQYCIAWDEALDAHALVGFDSSGTALYPDPSTSKAAANLQANVTFRNGLDGDQHEFEFDSSIHQFTGRPAVLNRYGNSRYGNLKGGAS